MNSSEKAMISAPSRAAVGARLAGALQVAGNVADGRVELRHGNGETVGGTFVHGAGLAPDEPVRQWVP